MESSKEMLINMCAFLFWGGLIFNLGFIVWLVISSNFKSARVKRESEGAVK